MLLLIGSYFAGVLMGALGIAFFQGACAQERELAAQEEALLRAIDAARRVN